MPRASRSLPVTLAALLLLTGVAGIPGAGDGVGASDVFQVVPDGEVPLIDQGGWLPGRPHSDGLACKPRGPVATELTVAGVAPGGVVELLLEVAPRTALADVTWRLDLPDGAELLQGRLDGTLAGAATSTRDAPPAASEAVTLRLPEPVDGRPVSVTLAASARGPGGDPLEVSRTLHWGESRLRVPERRVIEATGLTGHAVSDVPAAHRWGR